MNFDKDRVTQGLDKIIRSCGEYSLLIGCIGQNAGFLTIGTGLIIYSWNTPSIVKEYIKEIYTFYNYHNRKK